MRHNGMIIKYKNCLKWQTTVFNTITIEDIDKKIAARLYSLYKDKKDAMIDIEDYNIVPVFENNSVTYKVIVNYQVLY